MEIQTELIGKRFSLHKGREVELSVSKYKNKKLWILILHKIPNERMSSEKRKLYKTEKQALLNFNI